MNLHESTTETSDARRLQEIALACIALSEAADVLEAADRERQAAKLEWRRCLERLRRACRSFAD